VPLTRAEHRALHDLVRAVGARTGRAALAAEPLARPGEPLACTPLDAVECFTSLDLDAIAMGPYIVEESRARTG
jgi:carbamoyltransferase